MVAKTKQAETQREPRDLRYRNQHFPGTENLVFDTRRKGFVPLPIILRKVLWYLSPAELRVLVYLALRASKYGICYPTLEEIAHDLGMSGRKNLTPHLKSLEEKKFIRTRTAAGKKFFLILDPRVGIEHLLSSGSMPEDRLLEIDELLEDLHQQPMPKPAKKEQARSPQGGQT